MRRKARIASLRGSSRAASEVVAAAPDISAIAFRRADRTSRELYRAPGSKADNRETAGLCPPERSHCASSAALRSGPGAKTRMERRAQFNPLWLFVEPPTRRRRYQHFPQRQTAGNGFVERWNRLHQTLLQPLPARRYAVLLACSENTTSFHLRKASCMVPAGARHRHGGNLLQPGGQGTPSRARIPQRQPDRTGANRARTQAVFANRELSRRSAKAVSSHQPSRQPPRQPHPATAPRNRYGNRRCNALEPALTRSGQAARSALPPPVAGPRDPGKATENRAENRVRNPAEKSIRITG